MMTSPLTKAARHAQIAAILGHQPVRSQEELADVLGGLGVRVTQATLSRDLEEIGAIRLRGADGVLVYALPGEPGPGGVSGVAGTLAGGPFAPSAADPAARLARLAPSFSSPPRPAPTWSCCARRRARPSCSRRP